MLACLTLCLPAPSGAVPACPDGRDITQPDGRVFRLHLHGDEYFSWHETDEGYTVERDPADGFWKYAQPGDDRSAYRILPGARVGSADPSALKLARHAKPDAAYLRATLKAAHRAVREPPVALPVPDATAVLQTPDPEESPVQPPQLIPVAGTKTIRNVVLLACFSNHWNSGAGTVNASYGRTAVSEYTNLFNQVGHTADGAAGSVRDYYAEVSYSKLTVESVVSPWVQLPQSEAFYGGDSGGTKDVNWLLMISNAVVAADAAGFDFSQGDSDGDGWVDCLTVIHSGHGQEVTGNPSNCVWSKQGEMSTYLTKDGVKLKRCHTEPALRGLTNSTSIIRIGVICHEMGHSFGLPDLYDYSNSTYGTGNWDIMAYGCWNGSSGTRPAHSCAYCKGMLGFLNPVQAHTRAVATLARIEDNPAVLLLRDGMSNGEYFLLENRAKTGFDNDANLTAGMLIYHIDSKSANNDLGTWAHPLVKIEEADGDNSIGGKTAYSEAGDVWTSGSGLAGGFRDQTGYTSANAMLYQSGAYLRSDLSSSYSYLRVTNFSAAATTMSCSVQSLKTTLSNQTVYTTGHTVAWPACSQATQYEIQEGAPATLTGFTDGAEDENAMYDTWHLAGSVRRTTAGKYAGSYSYLLQYYDGSRFYSPVQSLTLQQSFLVTTNTALSFYLMSHVHATGGYLKCLISKNGGNTWLTLGTYNGYINSWTQYTFNYAALNGQGINAGDACLIRFVMDVEYGYGWTGFPDWGFALDDIAVTGAALGGYGGWTALSSSLAMPSYAVPARTNGVYAYRVRAYANATWQDYGTVGETTVVLPLVTLSLSTNQLAEAGGAALLTATLSQTAPLPVTVNLALTGTASSVSDYTLSPASILIPAGNLSGTATLTAVQDSIGETNETIVVDIGSVVNGEESGVQQVTAAIIDDDPPPGSFEEWVQAYCPGTPLATAFAQDHNSDGVQNGFDYAFGPNLATNAPLLTIFMVTNTPVIDIPKQLTSTVSYVEILIAMSTNLSASAWATNATHEIDDASEPTNRSWHVPNQSRSNGFFRLRGVLK